MMRSIFFLTLFLSGCAPLRAIELLGQPFIKGVALGLFSPDKDYGYEKELDEIKALHANYISLVVNINQDSVSSSGVYLSSTTSSSATIDRVTAAAHARGMSVFLFPIIYIVDVQPGKWRELRPRVFVRSG